MEREFNNKNIKPTLDTPSKMGKQLDTQFKREIRKSGMNLKENGMMINEKEESLKKKIFKLDKMETLVHTDETLSKVFNDMKQDAAEKFGYHWNETILNIIFNDYVLNSPKNLQKYKNTRAKHKTRRGEEGIKELQNDIEKEKEASSSAAERTKDLMGGTANGDEKEKVDELFGFGNKPISAEIPMNKRSKHDTYFVDLAKKRLVEPVPYALSPEEKQAIIQKYVSNPNLKQISWYNAVKQGIKGVPTEVADGSIEQMDQEMQKKYGSNLQTIPALAEDINNPETLEGYKLQVAYALKSIDAGVKLMQHFLGQENNYLPLVQSNFEKKITPAETAQRIRDHWFGVDETTGAASAGAYAPALDVKKEISETTTSSSSGQYSGPRIWAKSPASSRFANKPAWKGGEIVSESIIKGRDYLTESKVFKLYLLKNEIIDMLNESYEIGEAESFQQHSERMLQKLHQFAQENPELEKDSDFQELVKITRERAGQKQQQTGTIPTQTTVSEHHLSSKQEKIDFILQHTYDDASDSATYSVEELNAKSDAEIDALYATAEKSAGINEAGDDKGEVYFEIEARLRPSDPALAYADIEDIANTYGMETEDVMQIMHQVLSDREGRKSEDIESIVADALKELEHSAIKPVSFEELMSYLNNHNDMTGYDQEDLSAAYDRLTTDKAQLSLFENPDYKEAMVKDLKYTGANVEDESTNALEAKDGLFKGKWNENQNEGFGGDPEVGEDQYAEEQSANQYIALENQLKELTALKNTGKIQELKAKIDSMEVIPMAAHAGSPDELGHRDLEDLGYVKCDYEAIPTGDDDYDHELTIKNISNKPIAQLSGGRMQRINMLEPGQMFESKHIIVNDKNLDKVKDRLDEKAKSKSQQRFMGMVRAAQKGELKNPSEKVAKAAASMSDKAADDFASTKHKGLPEKKKKKINEAVGQFVEFFRDMQGEPPFTIGDNKFEYVWGKYPDGKIDIAVYDYAQDLVYDYNYFRQTHGIDETSLRNLNEAKEEFMNINKEQYKEFLKKKLTESAKSLKTLNESQKKELLGKIHQQFINESMIDDQPDSMINNQESSIAASMASDELNVDGQPVPNATSPVQQQQEAYDSDDIKAKRPMADKLADYSDDEPAGDESGEETSTPVVAKTSVEKPESGYYHSGSEDTETINDAAKFREMLKAKYGVESVSELSPLQRQQLMKDMNFGVTSPEKSVDMDFSQFNTSAADKAAFKDRDTQRLNYLAQNASKVNDIKSYFALANQFKAETGENMHHPMAILASIEQLPQDSVMRHKLSNIENALKSQMTKKIAESLNEERKTSSILNVEKLGAENSKNFKKDSAKEDGLEQDKTYPKNDGIHKAPVYPNPKDFYIEQDLDKVQREAKTMADIEKEALARSNGSLNNIGNATADGKNIPKRNLTKEEAMELALNRGDGMQDIVYDNKPSQKFEERMKDDMGDDVYKMREKKMEFRADAPMYNKDTQPTAGGDKKEENNKFKMGYNNESVTAKYRDEFGKLKLVEFQSKDVEEVTTISEGAIRLSVEGMGNKYSLAGKKINENVGFDAITEKYAFYIVEGKVVAIEKSKVIVETKIQMKNKVNESLDKMKKLMNYNPNNYVDTKKSVKF